MVLVAIGADSASSTSYVAWTLLQHEQGASMNIEF